MGREESSEIRLLEYILTEVRMGNGILLDILAKLTEEVGAVSATLTIKTKGRSIMPATIHVGGNGASAAPPAYQEWTGPNGSGASVPPVGPLTYASDNTGVATVDANGNITAVAVGTANITVTDGGNQLTASDVLTVTAATAVSATLALVANP